MSFDSSRTLGHQTEDRARRLKPGFLASKRFALSASVIALALLCAGTQAKEPPPVRDCCGDENYVYRPSKERIKISNSPEVDKQLAAFKAQPQELARMRAAIKAGNYVLQAHVNRDLYRMGSEQEPPEIREGWLKYYGPYVAMEAEQIKKLHYERSYDGKYADISKNPRHNRMVCPFARLKAVSIKTDKALLTYQFVHIARTAALSAGLGIVNHPLEFADKGKVANYRMALTTDNKYAPDDPQARDWWYAYTTSGFKETVSRNLKRLTKESVDPDQKFIPKLRELQSQITAAEAICNKPQPFEQ
jgi:hypothetical protein